MFVSPRLAPLPGIVTCIDLVGGIGEPGRIFCLRAEISYLKGSYDPRGLVEAILESTQGSDDP